MAKNHPADGKKWHFWEFLGVKNLGFCPADGEFLNKNPEYCPADGDFWTFWVDFCGKPSGYHPDVYRPATIRQRQL